MNTKPDRSARAAARRHGPGPLASSALLALGASVVLGVNIVLAATEGLGYSRSVTPGLVAHFAARFGQESRGRLSGWQKFVGSVALEQQQRPGPDVELLGPVNRYFNRLPFVSDLTHWRVEDYWASPAESFASNGGDCEDFSIAKYFALKELGVPIERLRITYVKSKRLDQAHMVLAYYPTPGAVPLVLDNLENEVRPASERTDLIPVYSFNDEDLLLVRQGGTDARAGSSSQIRLWRGLLDKLERELLY